MSRTASVKQVNYLKRLFQKSEHAGNPDYLKRVCLEHSNQRATAPQTLQSHEASAAITFFKNGDGQPVALDAPLLLRKLFGLASTFWEKRQAVGHYERGIQGNRAELVYYWLDEWANTYGAVKKNVRFMCQVELLKTLNQFEQVCNAKSS